MSQLFSVKKMHIKTKNICHKAKCKKFGFCLAPLVEIAMDFDCVKICLLVANRATRVPLVAPSQSKSVAIPKSIIKKSVASKKKLSQLQKTQDTKIKNNKWHKIIASQTKQISTTIKKSNLKQVAGKNCNQNL